MDAFRQQQKLDGLDGNPRGGRRPYGCPCCRKIAGLNLHKKVVRGIARARLRAADRRFGA